MPILAKISDFKDIFDISQSFTGKIQFFSAVFVLISLALYLLQGFALYTMSKKAGITKGWLSFVPIANLYILGSIADLYKRQDGRSSYKYSRLLYILYIIEICFFAVFVILFLNCVVSVAENVQLAIDKDIKLEPEMLSSVIPAAVSYIVLLCFAVIYTVFYSIALWRIFALFSRKNAVLFLVLSVLFSFLAPLFLFCIRNNSPAVEPENNTNFSIKG